MGREEDEQMRQWSLDRHRDTRCQKSNGHCYICSSSSLFSFTVSIFQQLQISNPTAPISSSLCCRRNPVKSKPLDRTIAITRSKEIESTRSMAAKHQIQCKPLTTKSKEIDSLFFSLQTILLSSSSLHVGEKKNKFCQRRRDGGRQRRRDEQHQFGPASTPLEHQIEIGMMVLHQSWPSRLWGCGDSCILLVAPIWLLGTARLQQI